MASISEQPVERRHLRAVPAAAPAHEHDHHGPGEACTVIEATLTDAIGWAQRYVDNDAGPRRREVALLLDELERRTGAGDQLAGAAETVCGAGPAGHARAITGLRLAVRAWRRLGADARAGAGAGAGAGAREDQSSSP